MRDQLRTSRPMQEQIKLLFSQGHGIRRIVEITGKSRNTVRAILRLSETAASSTPPCEQPSWHQALDWPAIAQAVSRGVTIKVLHQEHAPIVGYKTFWDELRRRSPVRAKTPTVRLDHKPGEFVYFDFADGIDITDARTGAKTKTQLFVGVSPFSSFTVGEFVLNQKQPTFLRAIENAFTKLGGVPQYVTVDNLKSAVHRSHLYDPEVNPTFIEFANHWGFAAIPTRPHRPRDKAAVEAAIGVIQRQFFNEVRERTFYSLSELNSALKAFLDRLALEPMKDHGDVSRMDRFATERTLLRPLKDPFEIVEWRRAKVHSDCHIQVERKFYSVPFKFVGHEVRVRISQRKIEVFSLEGTDSLAVHPRLTGTELTSTADAHYPSEQVGLARFEVKTALKVAERIGPHTLNMVSELFKGSQPLKFLRRVQGILKLRDTVSPDALEFASQKALLFKKMNYGFVKATALHFQNGGPGPRLAPNSAASNLAPKRALNEVHLHNNHVHKEDT
jgi:transposase